MTEAKNKKQPSSRLGATVSADGMNFSLYSKHATGIELLLFVDSMISRRGYAKQSDVTCLETDVIGRSNIIDRKKTLWPQKINPQIQSTE